LKIQIHESLAPLLRGIGLTLVLFGTVLAAEQTREHNRANAAAHAAAAVSGSKSGGIGSTNTLQDQSLNRLTQEIEDLRDTVHEETTVGEVLVNPWFGSLGTLGSAITAASFYVEWMCKRKNRG
jgi:hypothetical protein